MQTLPEESATTSEAARQDLTSEGKDLIQKLKLQQNLHVTNILHHTDTNTYWWNLIKQV